MKTATPGPEPGVCVYGTPRKAILQAAARMAALVVGLALSSCMEMSRLIDLAVPDRIAGLPEPFSGRFLPIRSWATGKDVTVEAMAVCSDPACSPRLAIGLFRAEGRSADAVRALLRAPDGLRRELDATHRAGAKGPLSLDVVPLKAAGLTGFAVWLSRPDGERRVTGAVFADAASEPLRFVFALGAEADVIDAARLAALASLR